MTAAARAAEGVFASMTEGIVDRLLDTLFKHAESKLGSDDQRKTLSAYSAIYENRSAFSKAMIRQIRSRLQVAIDDFLDNRLTRPGVQTTPKTNELSLVGTDEMERQVLSGSVGARAENDCFEAYHELNGRLATVAGLLEITSSSNPFRPEILVVTIDEAWHELRPDFSDALLMLQRLSPAVLGDLGPYVAAVNKVLADAGYEPTRHTGFVNVGGSRSGSGAGAPNAANAATQTTPGVGAQAAEPQRRVGMFKRIVEALSRQMGAAPAPEAAAQPPATAPAEFSDTLPLGALPGTGTLPDAEELAVQMIARQAAAQALASIVPPSAYAQPVGALSALQRAQFEQPTVFGKALNVQPIVADDGAEIASNYMDPLSPVDVALRTPLRFVNVIRSIADSKIGQQASQVDSMVIELVARLFDFVFEDDNLPDAIKVLLSRMQIPVLKAAMLDTEFFERENHPARRLVNGLANAGLGWEEEDGREDPLFQLIERTVQRVIEEFEEDLSLFDRLSDDVDSFVHRIESESTAAAASEVVPARDEAILEEERQLAMRNARRAVEERLREARTLPFVAYFLRNAWAEYIGDLLAVDEEDETPLRNALDTADDLIWSVEPKPTPDDRRKLLIKIPYLEQQLRSGMTRVAMTPEDSGNFLSMLDHRWAGAVIGEPIDVVEEVPEPQPEAEPDEQLQQIYDLRPGAILEMTKDDGARLCYKLGWISQGRSRYLLTNRLNSAPLIVTAEHLAGRLASGKMRIIDHGPLMDRAMNSILTALEEVRYPDAQAVL